MLLIGLLAIGLNTILISTLLFIFGGLFLFCISFFRNPDRPLPGTDNALIYSPADGKVVTIEESHVGEFLNEKRIQISIFMSPLNVHLNRVPITGKISYTKYHPGKHLVAWHPKSSTENERNTVVIDDGSHSILLRQIAGAVARRIVCYAKKGQEMNQGDELGFIKFGSRVDVFLPLSAEVLVEIDQTVEGNNTVLAKFNNNIDE